MNWDSVGAYGSKVDDITPNIDRLAAEGMRFRHAHVTIAICQPTRAVWMTGRYPHNSGALGFNAINRGVPTLVEALHDAGYYTGCFAKNAHVVPTRKAAFDESVQPGQLQNGRNPERYYGHTKSFLANAKAAGKPFFLMANAQDPHRPFAGSQQERGRRANNQNLAAVRRTYKPEEITVPGFLPDIPDVRQELSEYFTSVHRADETVGAVLKALDESGCRDDTLVMFLSDHGMPLPFAKTNVYYHSTRTPWIVRWPGVVQPGSFDERHFISGIDLAPTVLDALGLSPLEGMDGKSFLPVLKGQRQEGRGHVFTHINTIASQTSYPMRSVQDARFGYLYNAWSDGARVFRNESQAGLTMKAMNAAARGDAEIAARVKLFVYRTKEEFYDYAKDPDALHNLIDDPAYADQVAKYRKLMRDEMESSGDYLLEQFANDVK
jgi:N-sulfoglucosamine sulfohydrolase